jgi:hypothetical protein
VNREGAEAVIDKGCHSGKVWVERGVRERNA